MEVGKVFAGLALFSLLTMPLYIITMVINITVAACVSTRRLVPFLLAPELDDKVSQVERSDKEAQVRVYIYIGFFFVSIKIQM